jgi:hypothetical protein
LDAIVKHLDERKLDEYLALIDKKLEAAGRGSNHMILQKGITGLSWGNLQPQATSNYRAFRGHCYEAARESGAFIRSILTPRSVMACNYALAVFDFSDTSVAVLLNEVFPLLAFAVPPAEGQVLLEFVDFPKLAAEFERWGNYTILQAVELLEPLTREMYQELAPMEQKTIRYFRPQRVGDVIYNCWD